MHRRVRLMVNALRHGRIRMTDPLSDDVRRKLLRGEPVLHRLVARAGREDLRGPPRVAYRAV